MMRPLTDYVVDVGACTTVAVCRHCDTRMVRAQQSLVIAEMRNHIMAMHSDDRRVRDRLKTAIRREQERM